MFSSSSWYGVSGSSTETVTDDVYAIFAPSAS